jgi:hypothetical protein
MSTSIEKVREELISIAEKLGSLARGLVGESPKESAGAGEEPETAADTETAPVQESVMAIAEVEHAVESNGKAKSTTKKLNQSELVREFLKKHHGVRNKDIIEAIKKEHGIEVNPSLVSYIRNSSATKKAMPKVSRMKIQKEVRKSVARTAAIRSGSSLIREYLEKHPDASNEEVVKELKKSKKVEVRPTLVSSVRAILKRMSGKTSKISSKPRKGLPMTALVVKILEKSPKDGVRLSELSKKAVDAGYEYRGEKGAAGVTQNVYQALHALSRQIPHPGYEGKTAVVLHDGMRWRLNPKAKKRIA